MLRIVASFFVLAVIALMVAPLLIKQFEHLAEKNYLTPSSNDASPSLKARIEGTEMYRWQDADGHWHFTDQPTDLHNTPYQVWRQTDPPPVEVKPEPLDSGLTPATNLDNHPQTSDEEPEKPMPQPLDLDAIDPRLLQKLGLPN